MKRQVTIPLLLACALSACATKPCEPKIVTQEVVVPKLINCFDQPPKRPDFPLDKSRAALENLSLTQRLALVLEELDLRKTYESGLEEQIMACMGKQDQAKAQTPPGPAGK